MEGGEELEEEVLIAGRMLNTSMVKEIVMFITLDLGDKVISLKLVEGKEEA